MTRLEFLTKNQTRIDRHVTACYGENCETATDGDRWDWVLNDPSLNAWAITSKVNDPDL